MAWAEQRAGRWRACWRDGAGRRRYKTGFAHKAAAVRYAAQEESEAAGITGDPRTTWGQWEPVWTRRRVVEPSTRAGDAERVAAHIKPKWGTTQLGRIQMGDVQDWVNGLTATGMAAGTVRRVYWTFSSSMSAAVKYKVIRENPCKHVVLPVLPSPVERWLTADEVAAVTAAISDDVARLIVDVLVDTGIRWGELAGLHTDQIDCGLRMLYVKRTWSEKGAVVKVYPKERQPRAIPITGALAERLAEHVASLPARSCGQRHSEGRCGSALVFTSPKAGPLDRRNWLRDHFRPALALARRTKRLTGHVRIHDLRHTFGSWLAQEGLPLDEIQQLMGHHDIKITQRYAKYGSMHHDTVRELLDRRRGQTGDKATARKGSATSRERLRVIKDTGT